MPPKRVKLDPKDPTYIKIKTGLEQRKKERKERESLLKDDLFNNPMVNKAKQQISKEQQDKWTKIGEEMYNTIDFVDANGKSQTIPKDMMEGAAYVVDSIKSGMHISYLEKNERELLKEIYGSKWYERFGYIERDLTEIYTFPEQNILLQINEEQITEKISQEEAKEVKNEVKEEEVKEVSQKEVKEVKEEEVKEVSQKEVKEVKEEEVKEISQEEVKEISQEEVKEISQKKVR